MQLTNYTFNTDYIIPAAFMIIIIIQIIGIFIIILKYNNSIMMDLINELNDYKTSNEIYNQSVETRNEFLVNTIHSTTDILVSYGKKITEINVKLDEVIDRVMVRIIRMKDNMELENIKIFKTINQLMIQINQIEENSELENLENVNVKTELDNVKENLLQVSNKCHKMVDTISRHSEQLIDYKKLQMIDIFKKECIDGLLHLCKEHKFVDRLTIEDMSSTLTPNQIEEYKTTLDIDYDLIFRSFAEATVSYLNIITQNYLYVYVYGYSKLIDTAIAAFDNFITRVANPSDEFMTKLRTIPIPDICNRYIVSLVIFIGNEDITTVRQQDLNKYTMVTMNAKFYVMYRLMIVMAEYLETEFPYLQNQNITKPTNLNILSQFCQYYSNFLKNMRSIR